MKQSDKNVNTDKPAIILVAFGTSVASGRKVYEHIEEQVQIRYPDHTIYRAYTSSMIRRKLAKQGIEMPDVGEALRLVEDAGFKQVVLQSLHVVPGHEFHEFSSYKSETMDIRIGMPLLTTGADRKAVLDALQPHFISDGINILIGHGNDEVKEYNAELVETDLLCQQRYSNVRLCTVEGLPGTDFLKEVVGIKKCPEKVCFVPMLLVAGVHIRDDVMGDDPESWKNIMGIADFKCAPSLGENDAVLEIYINHLEQALRSFKQEAAE